MRAAIIGGGWAGLSAAVELAKAGVRVTVFEAAKQLGGRARSVEVQGQQLDNGQHILVGAYRETLRLMQEVGADPERLLRRLPLELSFPASQPLPFHLRLPRLPAPWHLACGLLAARGVRLSEKISAVRFMRWLKVAAYRIGEDCTVTTLLDRHHQHGSLRRHLWEPLCLAALNTPPAQASAQIFVNTLRDSLGSGRAATDLLLPAADLDRLFPAAAANFIRARGGEIHLSARVDAIDTGPGIRGESFDHVIVAAGPQHAAALLARHEATIASAQLLAEYTFEPIGTVYGGYPQQVRLPLPMLGLYDRAGGQVGQWVFDRGALCGTAGVMAFVLSGHGAWEALDNAALAALLHHQLAVTLDRRLPAMLWFQVIRERRATFRCRPNLRRLSARTDLAGCWLAGDYVCAEYPATLEAAVRSGVAAAREILLSESLPVARRAYASGGNSAPQFPRHG
ncbi:MAG: hydroxysqualene dehydroxylase HpnE [Candidatus Accumulibacter phosphatis]|uniref:15-cis-phytoene desaturase n=3 Tax=Candidatus Accumulibacter TaxID=327159 RepID=A0A080M6Y4_9PROT|nr:MULTISPECIES: hydroxysqualene dehydroxylase HpnE [Candidatus Accumulibacter]KFB76731.1 MAG: 15-cis-phytoene desaturase [Candidatus Accumulibacter cognatus]MBL8402359.1 FAD-dependent oxidoreductase [Accumulibacter sp.]MCC2869635.1 hydroxysqualene dehydroxylase HpnE [Candidatus Accumulibacter phosphatis]MCM8621605.1 hydroxysqualene dehydroxylase HpnE [Accumulibacter sp.]MCQ1548313.1 hydroxysqualene dehydroxylase HpnE [Candidatus Accumulibacter phosphatis]